MLNLGVSHRTCIPGRVSPDPRSIGPSSCQTCGAPGGENGQLLEKHLVAAESVKFLCPLCHACLHLDVAGRMKAGKIIWLPELSQERLNIMCLAMFVAFGKAGVYRKNNDAKGIVESATRLYSAFERRSDAIELFLGGTAVKSLMPKASLSSPTHIASLLVRAQREEKLSAREIAQRIDGMRLLPNPGAFSSYIDKVSRVVTAQWPVSTWTERVVSSLAIRDASASMETEGGGHFDASMQVEAV